MSDRFQLLPPGQGKCRECAVEHKPDQPHDATSFYYQFWFNSTHGRSATWADAMAHCCPELQRGWIKHLTKLGIDVNSTKVRGGITSKEELEQRLANASDAGNVTGGEP